MELGLQVLFAIVVWVNATIFLSPEFGTLVFVPLCYFGGLYWVFVLILTGNDDFASIIGVKSKRC